ncbi:MAG: hypothetical protein IKP86_11130 [Anaerolineaceae bacterium]|nr:hypothetical protein [Anaerolineaceae bacterium]
MMTYIVPILCLIALVVVIIFFRSTYLTAPPNKALIISGFRKSAGKPRVVIGGSTIRIPFLERVDEIALDLIQVDIKTSSSVPTSEYININVDAVANVKVGSNPEFVVRAAENFLNKEADHIGYVAQQVIEGNMREIIGQMKLSELIQKRDIFAQKVQSSVQEEMARMGLEVVNLTIQNFIDDNSVITDLGIENISQIRKDAAISKANAERDVAIAQALASDQSNKAKVAAQVNIAEQNKDLAIRRAQFKIEEDQKRATADAAYKIQEEAERRSIEIATTEADIAKREKEIELREKEVQLKVKELEANVKRKAEAERYAAEQAAEAKKYEEAQAAEAKRIAMEEEAKGIEAIGIAEARALELKAEAMAKLNEAGKLQMLLTALPDIVKAASAPLDKVGSITMYGEGNSARLVRDIMTTVNQVSEGVGLDIPGLVSNVMPKQTEAKPADTQKPEEKN